MYNYSWQTNKHTYIHITHTFPCLLAAPLHLNDLVHPHLGSSLS